MRIMLYTYLRHPVPPYLHQPMFAGRTELNVKHPPIHRLCPEISAWLVEPNFKHPTPHHFCRLMFAQHRVPTFPLSLFFQLDQKWMPSWMNSAFLICLSHISVIWYGQSAVAIGCRYSRAWIGVWVTKRPSICLMHCWLILKEPTQR